MRIASNSDLITLVTSAAITTDVLVLYNEAPSGTHTIVPRKGRKATNISTATTTTILDAPSPTSSSFNVRDVTAILIRNTGASSQTVTVRHTDGTTTVELAKAVLAAGQELHYDESAGWSTRTSDASGLQTIVATADTANSAADTLANVAGLTYAVEAGDTYRFRAVCWYAADATTSGSRWTVNGPAITSLAYRSNYGLTTTSETVNNGLGAHQLPAAANATSPAAAASNVAVVEGVFTPSAAGTFAIQFAAEAGTITAKAGSRLEIEKIINA